MNSIHPLRRGIVCRARTHPMKKPSSALPPQLDNFQLAGVLGQGAMSVVYRGVRGGREYAIKVLQARREQDVEASLRFRREAAAVARLDSPHIVKVVEVGEH